MFGSPLVAYIDPMSGTILIQLVVAGVIGGIAFFRRSIGRMLRLACFWKRPDDDDSSD